MIKLLVWMPKWICLVSLMLTDTDKVGAVVFHGCLFIGFAVTAVGYEICGLLNKGK